ncbi:MAG TPA: superoxide dismutase [Fe], partial [Caulobacteraceae bacterium]
MPFVLPPLPFAYDALEPTVSKTTFEFHHDKHHKAYVDTTNQMLAEAGQTPATLEEVVRSSTGKLKNQSGQAWNHDFFWNSLSPSGGQPSG